MTLLTKRLLAIAAMTVMSGPALAATADQNAKSGTLSPDISDSYAFFSESDRHSFTEILDLGVGADYRTTAVGVDAASRAQAESSAQSAAGIYDLLLALSDEPDASGAVLRAESSPEGTLIDLPALVVPGVHAARVPGTTDRQTGDAFFFSVAAIPQPGEWMTLLCGFVVVAFIARRKTSAFAD